MPGKREWYVDLSNEKYASRVKARRRLKALIRLAFFNSSWLQDFHGERLGYNILANVKLKDQKIDSLIKLQDKVTLNKRVEDRSEAEKNHLSIVLGGMRCFKRYPEEVRNELAKVGYFQYVGPDRLVIKQHDEAYAWYYILSGEVSVSRQKTDTISGKMIETGIGNMAPGYMFGEIALIHNLKRTITVVTVTDCELLVIQREDFDRILKDTVLKRYDLIQQSLSHFPYFKEYDKVTLTDCCFASKMKSYRKDEVILGDEHGYQHFVYFVVRGKCEIVEHLMYTISKNERGKDVYQLYDPIEVKDSSVRKKVTGYTVAGLDTLVTVTVLASERTDLKWNTPIPAATYQNFELKDRLPSHVISSFMRIYEINVLGHFNLGENLKYRYVISVSDDTECILIPKYWLFQRNVAYIWTRLLYTTTIMIPNSKHVLKEFLIRKRWQQYKKRLTTRLRSGVRKTNWNNMTNVPYSIRLKQDLGRFFEQATSKF